MLTLPHLLKKGLVVPRFVAAVVHREPLEGIRRSSSALADAIIEGQQQHWQQKLQRK
jgi:hypothetical protein